MLPNKKAAERYSMPKYSMPNRSIEESRVSNVVDRLSRNSRSPSPVGYRLKPLIANSRAWIPGGHPNSIGRNKLASISKGVNAMYSPSQRSFL